jgi:EAL domain-containing protein (putative c-di-GMP-specific phosphodiesterase class I)
VGTRHEPGERVVREQNAMMSNVAGERAARKGPPPNLSLLEAAIERGGVQPFFHPKFSIATREVTGVEALARIAGPQSSLMSPGPYVELAEQSNRIDGLTLAMARGVAKHVSQFNRIAPLPCAINISLVSLNRPEFAAQLASVIRESGLDCRQFTLEVSEAHGSEYGPRTRETMTELHARGFSLAVDDFGAGASNIDRLRFFQYSEVKIDPAFTQVAMKEAYARAALVSCVKLAKDLGLRVTAEGVETQEMWDFMAWLGVDEAQGFLMCKPLSPGDFAELLRQG